MQAEAGAPRVKDLRVSVKSSGRVSVFHTIALESFPIVGHTMGLDVGLLSLGVGKGHKGRFTEQLMKCQSQRPTPAWAPSKTLKGPLTTH